MTVTFRRYLPLILLALMIGAAWLPADCYNSLRYDRMAIQQGEWWRLFTAHWLHLSWLHLLMNALGLLLCFYIGGRGFSTAEILAYLPFSLLGTAAALFFCAGDLSWYVGLSGVLHGLLWLSLLRTPHYSNVWRWGVMLMILGKVGWEQSSAYDDMALAEWLGGRVESRAHLAGLLTGMIWALAWRYRGLFIRDDTAVNDLHK